MTRTPVHLRVLALLLSGAAALGLADTGAPTGWSATGPVSATASIHATFATAGLAVMPPAPAAAAVARDTNTGPTGRLGPNDGFARRCPADQDGGRGLHAARNGRPAAGVRSDYRTRSKRTSRARTFPTSSAVTWPASSRSKRTVPIGKLPAKLSSSSG